MLRGFFVGDGSRFQDCLCFLADIQQNLEDEFVQEALNKVTDVHPTNASLLVDVFDLANK